MYLILAVVVFVVLIILPVVFIKFLSWQDFLKLKRLDKARTFKSELYLNYELKMKPYFLSLIKEVSN